MLTRKQMWRRFSGGGRAAGERLSTAAPSAEPKATAAPEAPSSTTSSDTDGRCRKVSFNYVVRVVLVPCTKELRPLNEQLWWGADDYLDFRREYVLAMRSAAAAAASKQRDEEHQQPLPPHAGGPSASAGLDVELDADEPTKPRCTKIVADLPPPSPPLPLSLKSLVTSLPSTNPAAAAAVPGTPTATVAVGTSGVYHRREVSSGRVLSTSVTARSAPKAQVLSRPPQLNGPALRLSPSQSCVINTTKKWTPSAGMMAAKAVVEAEEEGYRTESMSSASDSSLVAGDDSETDSDDEAHQEHRGSAFGREQLRRPAAAVRRLPRRLICA